MQPSSRPCFSFRSFAFEARAQGDGTAAYPNRPVRIVVGFAAGAFNDIMVRVVAEKLSQRLGQPVVVENKPGAGGNIGAEFVARAAADGYTLLAAPTSSVAINPAIYSKLNYDPQKDFEPITQLFNFVLYGVVNAELPIKSVPDLVAYAKANPDKANFGSVAPSLEMMAAVLSKRSGAKFVIIPYKSTAETTTAVITNQAMWSFQDLNSLKAQVAAGKLRVIVTTGSKRSVDLPDAPTFAEAGFPGIELDSFNGLVAPKGTPPAIIAQLQAAAAEAVRHPDVVARFKSVGVESIGNTTAEFVKMMDVELKRWAAIAKETGIKLD